MKQHQLYHLPVVEQVKHAHPHQEQTADDVDQAAVAGEEARDGSLGGACHQRERQQRQSEAQPEKQEDEQLAGELLCGEGIGENCHHQRSRAG